MREKNARQLTLLGVLGAAVIVTCLLTPAMDRVGRINELWLDVAIMIVPTAVLTSTGYRYYGPLRSLGVAVVVMLLTSAITWVVAVSTLAAAVAASPAALMAGIILYAIPAACVLVFALLAMRIVPTRSEALPTSDHEQAPR
jgi:hypothetical protein